jgi:hypothetical protein
MMFAGRPELVGGRILSGKRGPGYSRLPPVPAFFSQIFQLDREGVLIPP